MHLVVIDGQGGGVGRALVEELKRAFPGAELTAVGTNAVATSNMMRAGADAGATGENAVVFNAARADALVGPLGIYLANSMAGEITPKMAEALCSSRAVKVAVPVSRCQVQVAGLRDIPLRDLVTEAAAKLRSLL